MYLFGPVLSGTLIVIGYILKQMYIDPFIDSVPQYFGQYLESVFKNYKYKKLSQEILIKYLRDIDISIKENVLDIDDMNMLQNFFDYNFILQQTQFEIIEIQKNFPLNQSLIEEIYTSLSKNLEIVKFAGLVVGGIGTGKTTLINELLKLPEELKGDTETSTGESVTKGPPLRYNNPNYIPWLILFDTQGFDKNINFYDSIDSMKKYIEGKFKSNGNEFINFILYCIDGERFTKAEKDNLIKLHNLYPSNKLPIIIVNTRGLNKNADILLNKIEYGMKNKYGINDFIYISISTIKNYYNQEFQTKNLNKLKNIITNFISTSLNSTLYKLFYEKLKETHKKNMDLLIDEINLKNITKFDENYKLILKNCLNVNVQYNTLNTIKNHFFKILEKKEIIENVKYNIHKLRNEFEEKTYEIIKNDFVEKYKQAYIARVSEHAKNGTIILMKKLVNEEFIIKNINELYLDKSHKIKLYVDKLIKNFKSLNKL